MERIKSIDDAHVAAYRNLRDRTLRGENLFIAEAVLVVRRLLRSRYPVESIFTCDEFAEDLANEAHEGVPVYVADRRLMAEVAGFPFHRGAMAIGRRVASPSVEDLLKKIESREQWTLIVCPETTQAENLGIVFRTAAAFGVDAVLLGPRSCDPLCRRALRVSMGAVLETPFARSADLAADLTRIRESRGLRLVAAVLSDRATRLPEMVWPERVGLLIGNEFHGLSRQWLALCDHHLTIPMAGSTDSLNLGVATGIFVYERMREAFSRESD